MTKPRKTEWTQVIMRRRDHALLRRLAAKADLPMGVVVQSALHDLARKWRVDIDEVDEEVDEREPVMENGERA